MELYAEALPGDTDPVEGGPSIPRKGAGTELEYEQKSEGNAEIAIYMYRRLFRISWKTYETRYST